MSLLQQAKLVLVTHLGLAKDALHIYVALAIFLGACLLFKWKASEWKPWALVLAAALLGEAWDLRDRVIYDIPVRLAENWKDVWNTMLIPTVLLLATRYSKIFRR